MYVRFRAPGSPTLLLDLINPYHPSPWSQFPFFSPYLLLHPPPISYCWHRTASLRVEALIQGWEVWYSPSHSLSICALFVMRGLYRRRNSSLPSDPISDLNILAVPPCKCRDEKSCPFTNALRPSISPQHFPPIAASTPLARWHRPAAKSYLCQAIPRECHLFSAQNHLGLIIVVFRPISLAPLAPCLTWSWVEEKKNND